MFPVARANSYSPDIAATIIQRNFRRYYHKKGRVFNSEIMNRMSALASTSIENISFAVTPRLLGKQPLCALLSSTKVDTNVGYYRLPIGQSAKIFKEEQQIQTLVHSLGLTSAVGSSKLHVAYINMEIAWPTMVRGKTMNNDPNSPIGKIFEAPTLQDAIRIVHSLSAEEKDELWQRPLDNKFWMVTWYARALITVANYPPGDPPRVPLPMHFLLQAGSSGHSQSDVDRIPPDQYQRVSKNAKIEPSLMDHDLDVNMYRRGDVPWSLPYQKRKEFFEAISHQSFEQVMVLSLLLEMPLKPEHLNLTLTHSCELAISIFNAPLRVFQKSKENCLIQLPHFNTHISASLKRQIQLWPPARNIVSGLAISPEQKIWLEERIKKLKSLVLENQLECWADVVELMNSEMALKELLYKQLYNHFVPLESTLEKVEKNPHLGLVDLLHEPVIGGTRARWAAFHAFRTEVEKVVSVVMPRVAKIVEEYAATDGNSHREPFFNTDDKQDVRKFIGTYCCGPTTTALAILLRAHGYQAEMGGSLKYDHAFVNIPHESGIELYVDPTYKQLFFKGMRQTELYWHKIAPAIVGSAVQLKEFYLVHNKLEKPFTGHHWILGKREYRNHNEFNRIVKRIVDPKYIPGDAPLYVLSSLIKAALTSNELENLKSSAGELEITSSLRASNRPMTFANNFVKSWLIPVFEKTLKEQPDFGFNFYASFLTFLFCEAGYNAHKLGGVYRNHPPRILVEDIDGSEVLFVPMLNEMLNFFSISKPHGNYPIIWTGTQKELETIIESPIFNSKNEDNSNVREFQNAARSPEHLNNAHRHTYQALKALSKALALSK